MERFPRRTGVCSCAGAGSISQHQIGWSSIGRRSAGHASRRGPRTGYGTSIIRELIPFELGGTVDLAFACDGLRCRLEIPAEWTSSGPLLASDAQRGIDEPPWQLLIARQETPQTQDVC